MRTEISVIKLETGLSRESNFILKYRASKYSFTFLDNLFNRTSSLQKERISLIPSVISNISCER